MSIFYVDKKKYFLGDYIKIVSVHEPSITCSSTCGCFYCANNINKNVLNGTVMAVNTIGFVVGVDGLSYRFSIPFSQLKNGSIMLLPYSENKDAV